MKRRRQGMSPFAARDAEIARLKAQIQGARLVIYYEYESGMDRYRVWRNDYPGDAFEVVPRTEFEAALPFLRRYPTLFVEGLPDDED